jgi:hypothetical protein
MGIDTSPDNVDFPTMVACSLQKDVIRVPLLALYQSSEIVENLATILEIVYKDIRKSNPYFKPNLKRR